ncbi:MAG: GNAT family N-acetyltransferase [Candidatus Diapherotrites archaeon]|nr:GNAT family N-acetyltransferase [Candidatus Diapherotrites archaeon]
MRRVKINHARYGNVIIAHSGKPVHANALPEPALINVPRKIGGSFALFHKEGKYGLHISRVYVHPKRRGHDLAGEFLKDIADYAKKNKIGNCLLM